MQAKSSKKTGKAQRIAAAVAGVLLLTIAVYHGSGFQGFSSMLHGSSLNPEFVQIGGGLWLFFSWHMLILSFEQPLYARQLQYQSYTCLHY